MFLIAAVLAAVLVFSAFALSQKLSVQRYVLSTEKLGSPVRLAIVADLHSTLYGESQDELIAAILQESPDAVLFVGDIVDDWLSEEPVRFLFEALSPQCPCLRQPRILVRPVQCNQSHDFRLWRHSAGR